MVERFGLFENIGGIGLRAKKDGEFVRFSDYEALAKELAEARAIVGELVDHDLSYQGENIVIPTDGHGNAIALVMRARRFLEGK